MFGSHFYHQKVRKCVAMFGTMFNNIYVIRKNSSGAAISQVKVPLSYAPKEKYLERIRENPDLVDDTRVAIKLPRMSFEITSMAYDPQRQLTKVTAFNAIGTANTNRQKFYSPVPYSINFQLNVYAKNQDDALQIVEQIIPTFNPQYTLTINPFATEYPTLKEDIPIIIQGVSFADDFEGALEQRRTIIYTLDFEMKVQFYGNITTPEIIRKSIADVYLQGGGLADSDVKIEKITVTPSPLSTIGLADSDFGFSTDINILNERDVDVDPYVADGYVETGYFRETV
jgi:hypothetical protein